MDRCVMSAKSFIQSRRTAFLPTYNRAAEFGTVIRNNVSVERPYT